MIHPDLRPHYDGFNQYLHTLPCLKCHKRGVEIAHLYAFPMELRPGVIQQQMMPHRKDLAIFAAIPLCAGCHRLDKDSIHNIGEEKFFAPLGGERFVFGYMAKILTTYFVNSNMDG